MRPIDCALRRAYAYDVPARYQRLVMPVTATLSRKFYEKFGDDITNELVNWFNQVDATYRSELRELNELNFARFDARLEQRSAEVKAELRAGLAELDMRFAGLETKFAGLEGKFGGLEARLVRWMFLFWVASLGTVITLLKV